VGMGEACRIAAMEMAGEAARIEAMRNRFWQAIDLQLEAVQVNGTLEHHVPGILNASFRFIDGEALMMSLAEIAVSSGSACTSASIEPSYVLRALGLDDDDAHGSIRFSFGRFTTDEDVDVATNSVVNVVTKLRERSPAWQAYKSESSPGEAPAPG